MKLRISLYTVCQKTSTFYFSNNSKLTEFSDFWCVKSWENLTSTVCTFAHLTLYCSHFTLGNLKVIFNSIIHTYFRLFTLSQKKKQTVTPLPTTPEKCYRTTFFIFFTRTEYQSAIWTSCGSVLLQHGLNFSRAWWTMQLISGEKDWKHISVQKVVTLKLFEHLLQRCLPDILFATHYNRFFSEPPMPTHNRLFSEPPTFGGMQHTFSQMKKLCILQGSVVTFFRCGARG